MTVTKELVVEAFILIVSISFMAMFWGDSVLLSILLLTIILLLTVFWPKKEDKLAL